MSHVDEGTLHAYLDGALESLPAAEAERVRRHLASCEACQARLKEEQAVRDEAADILGGATLEVGDLPSFEELRARARDTRATPAGFRLQKLTWAATVVFALGTGWLLRGGIPQPTGRLDTVPVGAGEAGAGATAPTAADAQGPSTNTTPAAPEVEGGSDVTAAPSRPTGATRDVAAPTSLAGREVEAAGDRGAGNPVGDVASGDSAAAAGATRPAELWAAARERQSQERLAAPFPAAPLATVADPSVARALADQRPGEARRAVELSGAAVAVRGEALTPGGPSLVVPGLAVISVSWLEQPDLVGAVRVLQLMEGGDTLELVHLPAGVDPGLLPTVGDGRTQVLAPRDGGWLVVRARASAEVLSGLLRRLERDDWLL